MLTNNTVADGTHCQPHLPHSAWAIETLEWYHALGLTWEEVASALDTSTRSIQRWREHATAPSRESLEAIERMDELRFWLRKVFDEDDPAETHEEMVEWLHTRLEDLRGKTPREALLAGRAEYLIEMLAGAHTGAFI